MCYYSLFLNALTLTVILEALSLKLLIFVAGAFAMCAKLNAYSLLFLTHFLQNCKHNSLLYTQQFNNTHTPACMRVYYLNDNLIANCTQKKQ